MPQVIPEGTTHKHDDCQWALASFLKYENDEWFSWYGVGRGEWLPVTYPEWISDITPVPNNNHEK